MGKDFIVVDLGKLLPNNSTASYDTSVDGSTAVNSSSSRALRSKQRCGIGRRRKREILLKAADKPSKEFPCKSSSHDFSSLTVVDCESDNFKSTQDDRLVLLNASENNSTATDPARTCRSERCGAPPKESARTRKICDSVGQSPVNACPGGCHKGLVDDPDARALMNCCVQNTVDQVTQMHIKGADCQCENPYAALRTDTFKKLLKTNRRRSGGKAKKSGIKIKWCRPKTDECDGIQLQLCPKLGEGHTHERLISEVTPMLMRTAKSLDCQLREVCRRLFFMKQNLPQMTAPALLNFHAILATITRMLMADFASFPSGLRLPSSRED